MNGVGIIGAVIIGLAAGWIAERVMNRSHGLLVNLIVGLVGAVLGSFLAGVFGFAYYGWLGSLIVATVGAIVLLFLLSLVSGRRTTSV